MSSSWRIGKAFGIGLYIHWTFWLLPLWVTAASLQGGYELALSLGVLAAAFGCVLLHELGHALTARQFGIGTRDITLYPIGGVARLEGMGEKPLHEFCIAVAGPLVNVVIAAFLACLLAVLVLLHPAVLASVVGRFLLSLLFVNVVMVLFNLLPAFPMDGGRVLRSLLAMRLGQLRATRIAAGIGAGMALLIGLGGTLYLGNPWLMVIAFFVFMAGQAELQAAYAREYQRGLEPADEAPAEPLTPPLFSLQSHITVYTWDAETRQWVKAPTVRSGRVL